MPGIAEPTILDAVHESCRKVIELYSDIQIDYEAVHRFARQLDTAAVREVGAKAATFPIKFASVEEEVTFMALYHLLNFGSGYEELLQAKSKRGAEETIMYGCFGLALSAKRLDAAWMRSFSAYHVHNAFAIEAKEEQELQPGITISRPGPLAPLVAAIQSIVVQAGRDLERLGSKSFGGFIVELLDSEKYAGKPVMAAELVEELADSFRGFQDSGLFIAPTAAQAAEASAPSAATACAASTQPSTTTAAAAITNPAAACGGCVEAAAAASSDPVVKVMFLRKAQGLVADLGARFGPCDPEWRWPDTAKLSADSGAVLPAVLHHLGLIRFSDRLTSLLEQQQGQLPPGNDERAIRAAAVAAVDAIVAAANAAAPSGAGDGSSVGPAGFTPRDVSSYLLSKVSAEGQLQFDGQPLKVHFTKDTTAY